MLPISIICHKSYDLGFSKAQGTLHAVATRMIVKVLRINTFAACNWACSFSLRFSLSQGQAMDIKAGRRAIEKGCAGWYQHHPATLPSAQHSADPLHHRRPAQISTSTLSYVKRLASKTSPPNRSAYSLGSAEDVQEERAKPAIPFYATHLASS